MDFIKVCLEELGDSLEEYLRYNALSTRLSKLENDDFKKFMNSGETISDDTPIAVDHEAQLKEFLNG